MSVDELSDDAVEDQQPSHLSELQGSIPRSKIAKRQPAKRKQPQQLLVNKPPTGCSIRQRLEGKCGCLCECFVPLRSITNFERLMKLRKEIAALEKVEQDNYA